MRSFAYPFGYHAAGARRAVRQAGFAQACVVGDLPASSRDDRWAQPRLQVKGGTTPQQLLEMVRWQPSMAAWCCVRGSCTSGMQDGGRRAGARPRPSGYRR